MKGPAFYFDDAPGVVLDNDQLDALREASDAAWRKIAHNPDRIRELDDEDLAAVAANVRTLYPLGVRLLLTMCDGDEDVARAVLDDVGAMSQARLVRLVRKATATIKAKRPLKRTMMAALTLDYLCGCGAVRVEEERRRAVFN